MILVVFAYAGQGNPRIFNGKVLEVLTIPGFKYLKLEKNNKKVWVGIMDVPVPFNVSVGDKVRYDISTIMKDYESKLLKRKFDVVIFAANVELIKEENNQPKTFEDKVSIGTFTIDKLYSLSDKLEGKIITVKGKVTKVSKGIMERDWVHLSDGTRSSADSTNDLTLTTVNSNISVGSSVTAKGKLVKNKDFGGGYFYKVIIEETSFKK